MKLRIASWLSLLIAVLSLRAEVPGDLASLSDPEVLARATSLSIEDRRYLVYLYARLNKPHVAQSLANGILVDNPRDRQTLLVLASMAVEQKDAHETLRLARKFLGYYPGDHQGRYFLGAGLYLAKQYADANAVLRDLKVEQFSARKYPYETDLAASAYAAGDWYRAMLSYQDLLRHHQLGDELRDEVRRVLDSLYREHRARLEATAHEVRLDRARVWRYGISEASHLSDRQWLALNYGRDDVTLESALNLRAARSARAEAAASLTTVYDRRWTTDGWVGASGAGMLAGGRIHYTFAKERVVTFEVVANARATDSLALEFLDGREDRAALALSWRVEADLVFAARAQLRELFLAHQNIGRGAGLDLNLDQTITREGHGPRVILGYRGSYAAFTAETNASPSLVAPLIDPLAPPSVSTALVANLVSRRLNRHGVGLLITDNLAHAWAYRFNAGADYDFELSSPSWNAAVALSFFPRKSIELTAEAGYTSSASASNAGSAATILNLFARSYY